MAVRKYIDGDGAFLYRGVTGDGSESTPDSFWMTLVQEGNTVSPSNPLPVARREHPVSYQEPQLTGVGFTTARDAHGYSRLMFGLSLSELGEGDSFSVTPEFSRDNLAWFPLGEPYEFTDSDLDGDGKTTIVFAYELPLTWVRLNVTLFDSAVGELDVTTIIG
jgi:hypothetical protein